MGILTSVFGTRSSREVKGYTGKIAAINAFEPALQALSDADLKAKTGEFRERLTKGETLDALLTEAFAVVREASRRTLGQRHYDVQLIGGIILHEGKITEMKTGEGKTLVATLPTYLNALTGKGVHVVTVNDYLSRRDGSWMGQIYHALGLTVGIVNDQSSYIYDPSQTTPADAKEEDEIGSYKVGYEFLKACSKREAYHADITYGTNNQFGFDYLRDNIEHSPRELRHREFNYAIVDEVDSILIDEARTPLIISAPTADSDSIYLTFAKIAKQLEKEKHFTVDEKFKSIAMTQEGIDKAEELLGVSNIYTEGGIKYVHHLETAVKAKALYNANVEYLVKDKEVLIVDPSTGRLQPGRRWSEGLHQAIEAKEGVPVQQESRTYASITFQNFFRLYPKLAGMTGTGMTSSEEFLKVYGLDVIEVPTYRPVVRIDSHDQIFRNESGKFKAIARKVKELNVKGQPVLIGTVSIEKNQLLSDYLKREGVPHTMLNAKPEFAEKEGETVAGAGRKGAVTIATNMAGRGVDIKLGGAPVAGESAEALVKKADEVRALGGLFVLGTERHEARRIDNQLRGRSGRQGDPGETQFYVSLEDDLMRVFANDMVKKTMDTMKIPDDYPIEHRFISRSLENAQKKIEGFHFDSRRHVLEYDDVLNQQRMKVYDRRKKILLGEQADVESILNDVLAKATPEDAAEIETKRKEFHSGSVQTGVVPATDEAQAEAVGDVVFFNTARGVMLQAIDLYWIDHLEQMDYMRSSVNLRAYGQRDPLVEYKREGLRLFKEMEVNVDQEIIRLLKTVQGQVGLGNNMPVIELRPDADTFLHSVQNTNHANSTPAISIPEGARIIDVAAIKAGEGQEKIGRNDPCPCGSGKKYKKCGDLNTEEHQRLMAGKK